MWSRQEIDRVTALLYKQLGVPYATERKSIYTGAWVVRGKPSVNEESPLEFDCSGLSRWIIARGRDEEGNVIVLPHGTREQIKVCSAVSSGRPLPLDLGFADMDRSGAVDHVVICYDDVNVIEARGYQKEKDYNKVISRPIEAWKKWPGFCGWWRVPGIRDNDLLGDKHVGQKED